MKMKTSVLVSALMLVLDGFATARNILEQTINTNGTLSEDFGMDISRKSINSGVKFAGVFVEDVLMPYALGSFINPRNLDGNETFVENIQWESYSRVPEIPSDTEDLDYDALWGKIETAESYTSSLISGTQEGKSLVPERKKFGTGINSNTLKLWHYMFENNK